MKPNDWSVSVKLKGDWMPFPERWKQTDVTVSSVVCLSVLCVSVATVTELAHNNLKKITVCHFANVCNLFSVLP